MSSFFAHTQIINVENLRRVTDTLGWSGYTKVNFQLIKNTNKIFSFSNRIRVQYKTDKSLWLFINDLDFKEANSTKLVSKNAQHLRYNHKINPKLSLEAFLQSQQDKISAINFRGLVGSGIRYKFNKSDKYKLYLGSAIMFEHEYAKIDNPTNHNDFRNSSYFSCSLFPKENVSLVSTTYFQPRLDKFSDFRISSQTSIAVEVFKNLSFTTTFSYQYDKFPVIGITNEQYVLSNGLMYSFD